jgi:hypothetical protein
MKRHEKKSKNLKDILKDIYKNYFEHRLKAPKEISFKKD